MKVLVIPDIHLKLWMFDKVSKILNKHSEIEKAVCLGDLVDDFGCKGNIQIYKATLDRALQFTKEYPNTLWCYGNHDISYLYSLTQSGYSYTAKDIAKNKLEFLYEHIGDNIKYIHRIDNTIFMHGGLCKYWIEDNQFTWVDFDELLYQINMSAANKLWEDESPIWFRPQYYPLAIYQEPNVLQVVGHTPIRYVNCRNNILSCDSFSTHRDGTPYGEEKFTIVDTISHEWSTII